MSSSKTLNLEGAHTIPNEDNDLECQGKRVLPKEKKYKGGDLQGRSRFSGFIGDQKRKCGQMLCGEGLEIAIQGMVIIAFDWKIRGYFVDVGYQKT